MASYNSNRGNDYHLKSLGFQNRQSLEIISMDNVRFANDRVITKPDWVIKCSEKKLIHILDYKNRNSGSGPSMREMWQLLCYSWVVPEFMSWVDESNVILPTCCGILFGDGQRYNVQFTDEDLFRLQESVVPAIKAYRAKGLLRDNQKISATFLANYMVDSTLSTPFTSTESARRAGTKAHESMVNPASGILH